MVLSIISIIIAGAGLVISLIFSIISAVNNHKNQQRNAEAQGKIAIQQKEWENYKREQDKVLEKVQKERNEILENRLLEFTSKFDTFIQSYVYWNQISQDANANLIDESVDQQRVKTFDNDLIKFLETKEKLKGESKNEKPK